MIKISNGSGQGNVVSCVKVPIVEGTHEGGRDVLLLGEHALILALNGLTPRAFSEVPLLEVDPPSHRRLPRRPTKNADLLW